MLSLAYLTDTMSLTEAEIELEKRIYDRLFTHFSVEIKDAVKAQVKPSLEALMMENDSCFDVSNSSFRHPVASSPTVNF